MSDRHIVQKKFNGIFQEYRSTLLPKVINDWENLEPSCQNNITKVNDFFCGMHYVVGLADQAEVALKCWDKLLFEETAVGSLANGEYSKGESGTYRLIRICVNLFIPEDVKNQVEFLILNLLLSMMLV